VLEKGGDFFWQDQNVGPLTLKIIEENKFLSVNYQHPAFGGILATQFGPLRRAFFLPASSLATLKSRNNTAY